MKILTLPGINTFLNKWDSQFARATHDFKPKFNPVSKVSQFVNNEETLHTYVINISEDAYKEILGFDTTQIISGSASSALLDVGVLDMMILE